VADERQKDPSNSLPEFPLMVRVSARALDWLREKDIRHEGAVDRVVLGTRAVGKSWTSGAIDVEILPNENDATFVLKFQGKANTSTSGANGPAIIRSRTSTDFECTRQVTFDPQVGMLAGPTKIAARTALVFDGFDSNRRLGRRLITRVAEKRANEQFPLVQAIAKRDNETEIVRAFDQLLDAKLASVNRQIGLARYANSLFGPASKPHLASCSTPGCILIGVGNEDSPRKLVTCPPKCQSHAPIEIWVHQSLLGQRLGSVASIWDRVDQGVFPTPSQFQVMQLVPRLKPAERPFEVNLTEGWLVIGLQNDPATLTLASADR